LLVANLPEVYGATFCDHFRLKRFEIKISRERKVEAKENQSGNDRKIQSDPANKRQVNHKHIFITVYSKQRKIKSLTMENGRKRFHMNVVEEFRCEQVAAAELINDFINWNLFALALSENQ
jgi:hypothetical protein